MTINEQCTTIKQFELLRIGNKGVKFDRVGNKIMKIGLNRELGTCIRNRSHLSEGCLCISYVPCIIK